MADDIAFKLSILAGLVIGKHLGVAVFTFTVVVLGVSTSTRFELENTFLARDYWLVLDSLCRFSSPTSHTQTTVK
jgi:hypothetical protein